jgi:hypothetical protein
VSLLFLHFVPLGFRGFNEDDLGEAPALEIAQRSIGMAQGSEPIRGEIIVMRKLCGSDEKGLVAPL